MNSIEKTMLFARYVTAIKSPDLINPNVVAREVKEFLGFPQTMNIPHKTLLDKYRRVAFSKDPQQKYKEIYEEHLPDSEDWDKLFDMEN